MSFKLNRFLGLVGKSTRPKTRKKRQELAEILELLCDANSFESFTESQRLSRLDLKALTNEQVSAIFNGLKKALKQL